MELCREIDFYSSGWLLWYMVLIEQIKKLNIVSSTLALYNVNGTWVLIDSIKIFCSLILFEDNIS